MRVVVAALSVGLLALGQVLLLSLAQLVVALQPEDLLDRGDLLLDGLEGLGLEDLLAGVLHGGDAGAQVVVGPDHRRDAKLAEAVRRGGVVVCGHDDDRGAVLPCLHEGLDVRGILLLAVDEDGISTGVGVGMGAAQGLLQVPAGNEGLDTGNDAEVGVRLRILAGADLHGELVDVGQGLVRAAVEQGVGLGEELVLHACAGNAARLQLAHEAAGVVEVAVAGVGVQQDGRSGGVAHVLEHLKHLGPGRLVAVAHAEGGRDGEAAAPDALEAGFLGNAGAEAVVRLHEELELVRVQHALQLRRLAH
eukprot:m.175368 g.175368  ORF g.175368 m.175368 type:complete len:306 (+) comp17345_c0_seq2:2030-2947(+)